MKKLFAVIICIVLLLSFVACAKSADSEAMIENGAVSYDSSAEMYSADAVVDGDLKYSSESSTAQSAGGEASAQNSTEEKIIKTVELTIQTKEYEDYLTALTANVSSLGGYIENSTNHMGTYYSSNTNRNSTYVVRIPADKLDDFLAGAQEKGKIVRKTEAQKNVTLEYVDLESRINAYKTERATLTGLLEKAESLENVLSIQERLSEVNYEIESYTAQLRVLENRVSYSTVTLEINEVERVTEEKPTIGSRIKNTFLDSVDELVDWVSDFIVNFIGGMPIILPVAAVIVAVILILRRIIRKRRNK